MRHTDLHLTGPAERSELTVVPDFGGIEMMRARFVQHSFDPHFHDTFLIGMTLAGAETFSHQGASHLSLPGCLRFHNPGEIHAGAPAGTSWCYQALYPSPELMARVAEERQGRPARSPEFHHVLARDESLTMEVDRLFRALRGGATQLERESRLIVVLSRLLERYGSLGTEGEEALAAPQAVKQAQDYLAAHATRDVDLDSLARAAGLSRYQLLVTFKHSCGVTPAAFHAQCRALRARQMLQSGLSPVVVAVKCGYPDVTGLTRAFRRYFGVSPAQYRAAVRRG